MFQVGKRDTIKFFKVENGENIIGISPKDFKKHVTTIKYRLKTEFYPYKSQIDEWENDEL